MERDSKADDFQYLTLGFIIFKGYVFTTGDGCVYVWIVKTGECLRLINHNTNSIDQQTIVSIAINPNNRLQIFLFIMYSLNRIESIRHNCSPIILFEKLPCLPTNISFDNKGEFGIFINADGTIIYILNIKTNQLKTHAIIKQNLSYHDKITCSQIHPNEECLAIGTQSGRIALCEPTFRPRLGAPIIHVTSSNDQTFYACTHSDNTLHLIESNLSIQRTIGGINHMFLPQQASLPAALVMNSGKPDYLQFTSIDNGKLLYKLDIVGENYVSPNEIAEQCVFTDIKRLAIDPTDTWLVTFEERSSNTNSDDHQNERKLRFWKFNQTNNQFELRV
ncbi:unnamed protein product [Rotaria sp. Silwood1]|nr:unnamed protein product [Rotaria sp. Silwood1]